VENGTNEKINLCLKVERSENNYTDILDKEELKNY